MKRISIWNKTEGHLVNMRDIENEKVGLKWANKFISAFKDPSNYLITSETIHNSRKP